MKLLFTCGGTAGHINPALAVAEKVKEIVPGCQMLFVGSGREMENRLIPAEGYKIENITVTGFSRKISPSGIAYNIKTAKNLLVADRQCRDIIRRFRPDVVIGTGGYVCYPVLKTAHKMNIPTILHESNAVPGLTTKMLSGIVNEMLVAIPSAKSGYKNTSNIKVVGTPVRGQFDAITREEAKKLIGMEGKKLAVSFWGSLGASGMNEKITDFIAENTKNCGFYHIHATGGGKEGEEKLRRRLFEKGISGYEKLTDIRPYINNMGIVMKAADVVMCRAGASTLAEIALTGTASILVPSPYVTNNHQQANAEAFADAGAAKMMLESRCSGSGLYRAALEILNNEEIRGKMCKRAASLGVSDSAGKITDIILSYVK